MKYVIIGNSAAAIGTVEGIRKVDSEGTIMLISDESYHTYSRPLISYFLAGKVKPEKMYYREADFYERMKVNLRLGAKVEMVSPVAKYVVLDSGEKVPYEKLMLATGGQPIIPEIPGLKLQGVFSFLKWDDVKEIEAFLDQAQKVIVIGAGLIGLKAAEGLAGKNVEISVVELANRVLSAILDENAAGMVQRALEDKGIAFYLNNTVKEIKGSGRVTGVILQDGTEIACDAVIMAIGVSPNKGLAVQAGLQVNRGIIINEFMRTSDSDIYAAGDVSEGFDILYQQHRVLPIWPNAYRQGFAAGHSMAGRPRPYKGGFAMNAIGFFGLPMITAGIIKPDSPEFIEMIEADPAKKSYRKIVVRDGKLVGFISLNDVDRAGILTGLMDKEIDIQPIMAKLLLKDFGYVHLPREYRLEQLLGVTKS